MLIPILDELQILNKLQNQTDSYLSEYYAFYSSWYGGIIKNPAFMLLPIDDHMVHRGDGVFEAMKSVGRAVYLMEEHLERLTISAEKIGLNLPYTHAKIKEIILETLRVANQDDAMIRVFISRGPGNFSVNPYDSIGSQMYVVITKLNPLPEVKYINGVTIGLSNVPVKDSWLAQIKSCNYLTNVLMKKEAVDRKLDFVISVDDKGYISESATENIMIVDQNNVIVHPKLDNILKGTTMIRLFEIAQDNGIKTDVRSISLDDLINAPEIFITGTTSDVLPVVQFENSIIGTGKPGSITEKIRALVLKDIQMGDHRTIF
ncbi:MAG: aminotransferase class IV [Gammaproteobacteria bacterium]